MARIALDIDSTLHHYWDVFSRVVRDRCGVELRYEDQHTWGIERLALEEVAACIAETHAEPNVLAAEPYPGAVETVREWHDRGHWIHITSHRAPDAQAATARWLERIGLPYHDLRCDWDKVERCIELGIDLLIDDSPVNLERASSAGIRCATLVHPWNRHLIGVRGIVGAPDWPTLRERIEPLLAEREERPGSRV